MTNEEIDAMVAGREMDAIIAERVMGQPPVCRLVGDGADVPLQLDFPDAVWRERSPADRHWERFSPDGAERVLNGFGVPDYSTDIGAAWLVVEKMRADGWIVSLSEDEKPPHTKSVEFFKPFNPIDANAETDMLAICRAALKAVNAEVAALLAQPAVRRGLEGCGEMEED